MAAVSAELNAQIVKLMAERPSRLELGPLSLRLSGGARGGTPRHVPIAKVNILDAQRIAESLPAFDEPGAKRAKRVLAKVHPRTALEFGRRSVRLAETTAG
jgi:hypothetical protein